MAGGWSSITQMLTVRSGERSLPEDQGGAGLWHQADAQALAGVRDGHTTSRRSHGLAAAGERPLPRVFDGAVEYTPPRSTGGPNQVHARVWDGPADEGRRVVVLIAMMGGAYGRYENSAMAIARQVLDVPAQQVVWLLHEPGRGYREEIANLVLGWRDDRTHMAVMRRDRDATPSHFALAPVSWAEIEALVGEPVECYQEVDYTEATIRAWQQRGATLDVVDDVVGFRWRLDAIDVLDRRGAPENHHTSAGRRADAAASAALLAEQLREMLTELDRGLEDGTELRHGEQPRTWATRRVAPVPNSTETVLLGRYPGPFTAPDTLSDTVPDTVSELQACEGSVVDATTWTVPPAALDDGDQQRFAGLVGLLDRVQDWRDDVDQAAFAPDPALVAALDGVERALGWELGLLQYRAGQAHIPAAPPRSQTRIYPVVGPTDDAFLAGLTRLGPDDAPPPDGPGAPGARRRRLAAGLERAAALYRVDPDRSWFGVDPHGHLVVFAPAVESDRDRPGRRDPGGERGILVAEWPLRPPPGPIPDDAVIVADGGPGDRPVYLQWPTGDLTPWPGGPQGRVSTTWNFGPDGGCGLGGDIVEVLAAADLRDSDTMPGRWVNDQVERSDPDRLVLRVGDIRSRIGDE